MRPFERREAARRGQAGRFPYFKLARWNALTRCWQEIARAYETEKAARACALLPGRYRTSRIDESGRQDLEPFDVG